MKIEKLTENKIRIFLKREDIKDKNINLQTLMTTALESQSFFIDILNAAEEQFGFNTEGCRLLIEASNSDNNDFVFTITKYENEATNKNNIHRMKAVPKRISPSEFIQKQDKKQTKKSKLPPKNFIFYFQNFDAFCNLCNYLNNSNIKVIGIASSVSLHIFNNTYCLIVKGLKNSCNYKTLFYIFSEFGKYSVYSTVLESKILEYGKVVMKHNALNRGISYFSK